jgi:hypothetical protein
LSVTHQEPNRRHTLVNFPFSKFFVLIRGRSGSENTSEWIWIRENETDLNKSRSATLAVLYRTMYIPDHHVTLIIYISCTIEYQ